MDLFDRISADIKVGHARKRPRSSGNIARCKERIFWKPRLPKGADGTLTDDAAVKILVKMVKQRRESAEIYSSQNRADLAGDELAQVAVIEEYLPKQLSDEELCRGVA